MATYYATNPKCRISLTNALAEELQKLLGSQCPGSCALPRAGKQSSTINREISLVEYSRVNAGYRMTKDIKDYHVSNMMIK